MEAGFQLTERGRLPKLCTKLLELAAVDDLSGFLHEIEMGSDLDEMVFWYTKRFDSNKMGFEERTPFMIASMYGSTSVLKYLVESGKVDVNRASPSDGATALHCTAAAGSWSSLEVIKILIDSAVNVNAVNLMGKRAVDLIAPCLNKSLDFWKRKKLEILLNGIHEFEEKEEEDIETQKKKEYPFDVTLTDINIGIYGSDEFRMYSFKVKPCSRAYSHDWTECPFVHPGENARRRDLRKYHYSCVPCPEFKKGTCCKGDNCEYAHGVFESWLHPAQYRTRLCKDEIGCSRKVCFFAHKLQELRPLYASTGLDLLGSPCSSPINGGGVWQSKINPPPALQLPGRSFDLEMRIVGFEETENLSSTYTRNSTNLHDVFGFYDPSLMPAMQGLSPKFNPNIRTSFSSSHSRNFGFNSPTKLTQSFFDRGHSAQYNSLSNSPAFMSSNLSEWSSPDGKLEWEFNGEDVNKLRNSSSFGIRSENGFPNSNTILPPYLDEPEPEPSVDRVIPWYATSS